MIEWWETCEMVPKHEFDVNNRTKKKCFLVMSFTLFLLMGYNLLSIPHMSLLRSVS